MRRTTRSLVAVGLLAASAAALAEKPKDWDDQQAEEDSYWSRVAYPNRARYRELVQEARILSANPQIAGNLQRAEDIYLQAAAVEPTDPYAHFLLAELTYEQRRWGDCATHYSAVAELDPEWLDPRNEKNGPAYIPFRAGLCLALAGRVEESIEQYQRVIAANCVGLPGEVAEATVRWNLGDSLHALGRLEDAIAEYQRAIDMGKKGQAILHFALGVAYDRQEESENSREAMLAGINANPTLLEIANPGVEYLPPEDEDYYQGLAYKVLFEEKRIMAARVRAIAYFRRYVDTVGDQTWVPRAKQHLVQLGSTALGEGEIEVRPSDTRDKGAIVKAILAAAPALQACLDGEPYSVLRAEIALAPPRPPEKGKKPVPVPPTIAAKDNYSIPNLPGLPQPVWGCVISKIKQIELPATPKVLTGVVVDLIAR